MHVTRWALYRQPQGTDFSVFHFDSLALLLGFYFGCTLFEANTVTFNHGSVTRSLSSSPSLSRSLVLVSIENAFPISYKCYCSCHCCCCHHSAFFAVPNISVHLNRQCFFLEYNNIDALQTSGKVVKKTKDAHTHTHTATFIRLSFSHTRFDEQPCQCIISLV